MISYIFILVIKDLIETDKITRYKKVMQFM